MKAEIKRILSSDFAMPNDVWKNEKGDVIRSGPEFPPNTKNFSLWISADIGPKESTGAEIFHFQIVTPQFLEEEVRNGKHIWGRHLLIIEEFSWSKIEESLNELVGRFNEESWEALSKKLSRFLHWEFEDYRPHKDDRE